MCISRPGLHEENVLFLVVYVNFEKTIFSVAEDTIGGVEVCVNVSTEDSPVTVEFPFEVNISTIDGTASKMITVIVEVPSDSPTYH